MGGGFIFRHSSGVQINSRARQPLIRQNAARDSGPAPVSGRTRRRAAARIFDGCFMRSHSTKYQPDRARSLYLAFDSRRHPLTNLLPTSMIESSREFVPVSFPIMPNKTMSSTACESLVSFQKIDARRFGLFFFLRISVK